MSIDKIGFARFETINTNIKAEQKELNENDLGIVDIMEGTGGTVDCIENGFENCKKVFGIAEDIFEDRAAYLLTTKEEQQETDVIVDPLQAKQEDVESNESFEYLYKDDDIRNSDNDPEQFTRTKRARIVLKSQSGIAWSIEQCSSDIQTTLTALLPKCKGPAKLVSHPLESWLLYFDDPILKIILKHTNEAIRKCQGSAGYQKPTDIFELRAWLGLKYLCGIFRNAVNNGPLEELWSLELGNAVFRGTMSFKRFIFLNDNLSLIDGGIQTNEQMQALQYIFDKFLINCRSYYSPSNVCAVYEHSVCQDAAETKLLYMCDTKCTYLCNAMFHKNDIPKEHDLMQLICDIKGTHRCVFYDLLLANVKTASYLHKGNISVAYKLSQNSADMPKYLDVGRTIYAPALSLTASSKETAILACNLAENICIKKLQKVVDKSKETFFLRLSTFSTNASAVSNASEKNWQLNFLHRMLDIACLNAWTILRLSEKFKDTIDHRDFQRKLGLYLTQQQLQKRLHRNSNLSLTQKLNICELLGEPTEMLLAKATEFAKKTCSEGAIPNEAVKLPEDTILYSKLMGKRQRCRGCPSKSGNKTRFRCQQCQVAYCNKHLILRCVKCTGVKVVSKEKINEIM